jgi:hypothetical protein
MQWKPPERFVRNLTAIRVQQELKRGQDYIVLPEQIVFGWEQFVISVSRTRTMRTQIEGLSQEERRRLIEDYGLRIAGSIDVFIDKTTQEFSFTNRL